MKNLILHNWDPILLDSFTNISKDPSNSQPELSKYVLPYNWDSSSLCCFSNFIFPFENLNMLIDSNRNHTYAELEFWGVSNAKKLQIVLSTKLHSKQHY